MCGPWEVQRGRRFVYRIIKYLFTLILIFPCNPLFLAKLLHTLDITSSDEIFSVSECPPGAVAWDPHTPSSCAVGTYKRFSIVDTRKMEIAQSILDAHQGGIR